MGKTIGWYFGMKNFFSVESPLFRFFERLWDIIKLDLCWIICCIPVVTIGPATIAAFSITNKMVDDTEGYICRPFFKAFKENMKKGIPLGIMWIICTASFYLYARMVMNKEFINASPYGGVLVALALIFFVVYVDVFIYTFALLARYDNSLIKTIINSYRISLKFNIRTILLVAVIIVEVAICIWNTTTMIIGLIIGPGCIMLTISGFAMFIFRKLEKETGSVIEYTHDSQSDGQEKKEDIEEKEENA